MASAALSPAQGLWELIIICQATLWATRGKTFSFVSEHIFIYLFPRQQGKELGATISSSLGHCRKSSLDSEESKGSSVKSFPFPVTARKQGASDNAEQVLCGVCTYSFARSLIP